MVLLDVGAGKANDAWKWLDSSRLQLVVAFEPSVDQIQHPEDGFIARVTHVLKGKWVGTTERKSRPIHLMELYRPDGSIIVIVLIQDSCIGWNPFIDLGDWSEWNERVQSVWLGEPALVVNFFSMHYWCTEQRAFEKTIQTWKQWAAHLPQMEIVSLLMDLSSFPEEPPQTDLSIQIVKGAIDPALRRRSVCLHPPWSRRDYIKCWSLRPPIQLSVSWTHWKQHLHESGVYVPDLVSLFVYHEFKLKQCRSLYTWTQEHPIYPLPSVYEPWAHVFHELVLTL